MPRYRSAFSSDSEDDMHDGPYYKDGRFYPAGSRPSRSPYDDARRPSPPRTYSPPLGPRPSGFSYDDEPPRRYQTPSPPPRRIYPPPPSPPSPSLSDDEPPHQFRSPSPPPRRTPRGPRPSHLAFDYEPRRRATGPPPPHRARGYSSSHRAYSPPSRPSFPYSGSSRPPPKPESSYSTPPPPRSNSPIPYTIDEEEPDTIPHVPAAWNNFTSSSTREQLITFFAGKGFSREDAERSVGKEFAAHAPQYRSGQTAPGPSRAQEATSRGGGYGSGGPRPNFARPPSPERFSRYRNSARDRSESPEPNYGPYAGWRHKGSGPNGEFRGPPPFGGPPPSTRYD